MTGTIDHRQAALVILSKKRDEVQKFESIIHSARNNDENTEEWIVISWELEIQLLRDSIDTIEKWLVQNDFNY